MLTKTEKDILNGAAIGIACALASSKINKPSSNGRVNYKKVSETANTIAEAFFGEVVPDTKEAIEGYVDSMKDDVYSNKTTIADIVTVLDAANALSEEEMKKAIGEVEKDLSPDILSLRHIDQKSDELCDVIERWTEQNYEHKRRIASIPRPEFKSALAQARETGTKIGFYDKNGGISKDYIAQFTDPIHEKKNALVEKWDEMIASGWNGADGDDYDDIADEGAEQTSESATDVSMEAVKQDLAEVIPEIVIEEEETIEDEFVADSEESGRLLDAVESFSLSPDVDNKDDNFFSTLAEQLEHPLNDMSGFDVMVEEYDDEGVDADADTDELEPVSGLAETAVLPEVNADADADGDDADVDEDDDYEEEIVVVEETEVILDADGEEVEVPPAEVLEILEPEPVKDPTEPIVMDAAEIAEALEEEAEEVDDDSIVAEVAEAMVEEMEEAAELDPEECKSFTDQFMAVEIGPDGHARARQVEDSSDDIDENDEDNSYDDVVEDIQVEIAEDIDEMSEYGDAIEMEIDVDEPVEDGVDEGSDEQEDDSRDEVQEITEEILGIAAKTRDAIKKAVDDR